MDPDETLRLLRNALHKQINAKNVKDYFAAAEEAAKHAAALDGWLSHGGFLPKDWEPKHGQKRSKS